jgi:hypothetical protein
LAASTKENSTIACFRIVLLVVDLHLLLAERKKKLIQDLTFHFISLSYLQTNRKKYETAQFQPISGHDFNRAPFLCMRYL